MFLSNLVQFNNFAICWIIILLHVLYIINITFNVVFLDCVQSINFSFVLFENGGFEVGADHDVETRKSHPGKQKPFSVNRVNQPFLSSYGCKGGVG